MKSGSSGLMLVLGGGGSGKSRFAERIALGLRGQGPVYVATASPGDDEMRSRIERHRLRRGSEWVAVETAEADLCEVLGALRDTHGERPVLLDSLTMWTTDRVLGTADDAAIQTEAASLVGALTSHRACVICVSDDVSGGIVPDNPLGRRFRDVHGEINQLVAAAADVVIHVTAGLPLTLKGNLKDFGA